MSSNDSTPTAAPYVYFVAYMTPSPFAVGNATLYLTAPIDSADVLAAIKQQLETGCGLINPIVINFQLLSGPTVTAAVAAPSAVPAQV